MKSFERRIISPLQGRLTSLPWLIVFHDKQSEKTTLSTPPVLLLIFNRPEVLNQSFESIRRAKPRQLFIAADGPRDSSPSDGKLCEQARQIVDKIDWECNWQTLFRDQNLGCQLAVSQSINWFFDQVDEGIILEDDCVADSSFFRFCSSMLDRYRTQFDVGVITGNNYQHGQQRGSASYYFSKFNHCWGWATWKRAWSLYDHEMSLPNGATDESIIKSFACTVREVKFWKRMFDRVRQGQVNSWATRWTHSVWKNQLLTVTPQVNLVENIGFGQDATHTLAKDRHIDYSAYSMTESLRHPTKITQDILADEYCSRFHFKAGRNVLTNFLLAVCRRLGLPNG